MNVTIIFLFQHTAFGLFFDAFLIEKVNMHAVFLLCCPLQIAERKKLISYELSGKSRPNNSSPQNASTSEDNQEGVRESSSKEITGESSTVDGEGEIIPTFGWDQCQ